MYKNQPNKHYISAIIRVNMSSSNENEAICTAKMSL